MTIQIEPETMAWLARRTTLRGATTVALSSGDFSGVPTQPYASAEPGVDGFPKATLLTQKMIDGVADASDTLNAAGQMSILLQANTLESFRRMYLSQKQGRRELLAHAVFEASQAPKYDSLMLQQFVNTAKVVTE